MGQMANMRFVDQMLSPGGMLNPISVSSRDETKLLTLDHLKKIFVSPTIITDERLSQISPDENDPAFADVIGKNGDRYFFKESRHRDRFSEFIDYNSKNLYSSIESKQIIPVFKDGNCQTVLRFQSLRKENNYCIIAILSIDLRPTTSFDPIMLRDLFGFTVAESRIAVSIYNGLSVNDTAKQVGVRVSTVRDQLSSIFAKTRTSRQSELVSILSRLETIVT